LRHCGSDEQPSPFRLRRPCSRVKGAFRMRSDLRQRVRCPRAVSQTVPGRLWVWSPRCAVDSRQVATGNARCSRVSGSAGLELSQRRMRSPWRVPRWSAERRARPAGRAAAPAGADHGRCAYRRSASLRSCSSSCPYFSRTRCSAQSASTRVNALLGAPPIRDRSELFSL
jgi:hypothetical protein